jgi:hypothetical protein
VTDIDPRSDITLSYHDGDLYVAVPLDRQVTEMWSQRYEALAKAKGVQAFVRGKRDDPARLHLTVPNKTAGKDVLATLDVARALIAEADEVDQSPGSSESPEAVVREWWKRQRS